MITQKSGLREFASALEPSFAAPAETLGAVRLLAALAAKSAKAQGVLDALQTGAAEALRELGFANAAKDAERSDALAAFAPVLELDDADADDGADDEATGQIAEALDAIAETTKSLGDKVEQFDARLAAMENRTGTSFGRGWDDSTDDDVDVTMKSNGNDLWAGSAFALQA